MTKFERWGVATIAASIVVVAAAGSSDSGKGEYQERREYVENLDENAKKELLEKRDRFLKLSPEEQEKLRRLHRAIQDHEDREELERVMEAYSIGSQPTRLRTSSVEQRIITRRANQTSRSLQVFTELGDDDVTVAGLPLEQYRGKVP